MYSLKAGSVAEPSTKTPSSCDVQIGVCHLSDLFEDKANLA